MCELLDKYMNQGIQLGKAMMLTKIVDSLMANMAFTLRQACESIGVTVEQYMWAKRIQAS